MNTFCQISPKVQGILSEILQGLLRVHFPGVGVRGQGYRQNQGLFRRLVAPEQPFAARFPTFQACLSWVFPTAPGPFPVFACPTQYPQFPMRNSPSISHAKSSLDVPSETLPRFPIRNPPSISHPKASLDFICEILLQCPIRDPPSISHAKSSGGMTAGLRVEV